MSSAAFADCSSVLVIAEGRAVTLDWPEHLGETPSAGWALVEQEEWEGLPAFLGRVGTVLGRDALDAPERTVVFVASAWTGRTDVASRRLLVLEVLTHLARTGGGSFVLSHDHLQDADSCAELTGMASDLAEDWQDSGVTVSTCFDPRVSAPESQRVERAAPSRVHHTRPTFEPARAAV
jgi:hypothetical protein